MPDLYENLKSIPEVTHKNSLTLVVNVFGNRFDLNILGDQRNPDDWTLLGPSHFDYSVKEHTDELFVLELKLKEDQSFRQQSVGVFITDPDLNSGKLFIAASVYSYGTFEVHFMKDFANIKAKALDPWHHNNTVLMSALQKREEYVKLYGTFIPKRVESTDDQSTAP